METNFFCGNALDRLSERRIYPSFVKSLLHCRQTGFLVFDAAFPLAEECEGKDFQLCCLGQADVISCLGLGGDGEDGPQAETKSNIIIKNDELLFKHANLVLLGENLLFDGTGNNAILGKKHIFAVELTSVSKKKIMKYVSKNYKINVRFLTSRSEVFKLPKLDAAMMALSKSMLDWNRRYAFCATCGSNTKSEDAGYKRTCMQENCSSNNGKKKSPFE
eukprot:gene9666-10653_t